MAVDMFLNIWGRAVDTDFGLNLVPGCSAGTRNTSELSERKATVAMERLRQGSLGIGSDSLHGSLNGVEILIVWRTTSSTCGSLRGEIR